MADENKSETQASSVSRRGLLQIIGSVPAMAAVAAGAPAAHQPEAGAKGSYKRQTFDDHQWQTVRALCDLIIPADQHSGSATQAGVPEFLDDWIAFRTDQDGDQDLRAEIFGGIMWLDHESHQLFQKTFVAATPAQQKQLLDRIAYHERAAKEDSQAVAFFNEFRALTVGGFYSSKMGVGDLPFLGNVAVAEWKGCDPKVWAIIEERMKNGYKGILEAKPWSTA
jgi:hypothetical protein